MKFNIMTVLPLAMATIHIGETVADTVENIVQYNAGVEQGFSG